MKKIFERYFTSVKKSLTFDDIITIFNKDANMEIPDEKLKFCFAMSKMVVTNEALQYAQYNKLLFPEWLEFIGRLGDLRYKNTADADEPLAWKIE